jgi:hypothetical protein
MLARQTRVSHRVVRSPAHPDHPDDTHDARDADDIHDTAAAKPRYTV